MKISILVWNLSSNSLVRIYPIAKVLEKHYQVEVIGPVLNKGIYSPYRDELQYKPVSMYMGRSITIPDLLLNTKKLIDRVNGDVIYVFKPLLSSFGIGILSKYFKHLPLVLDIEDWETGFYYSLNSIKRTYDFLRYFYSVNNSVYCRSIEFFIKLADNITVVSNFLQDRYGGTKLPHGADFSVFNPDKFNRVELRQKWNINDKYVILFTGVVLPHKGLDDLIQALNIINSDSICLMIVGLRNKYLEKIETIASRYLITTGPQPHSEIPKFLSLADLVVLPQKNQYFAQAQIPGKLFEAMAMAKPIIATEMSDMPEILDDCGWIVKPGNPKHLAETIKYVMNNPALVEKKSKKAQDKYRAKYSWKAMERILTGIFDKYK